jgi:hypothetical protein
MPVQQSGEGSPRKRVGRAGNSRRQTMDFVEVPPSPVRRPATVGHPFRTVFDGAGQPAGMSFEGDKPGLYNIEWAPPKPAGTSLSKQYGPASVAVPVASLSRPSPALIAAQSRPAPAPAVPSSRPPTASSLQPPAALSRQGSLQPSAPAASSSQQASLQPWGSAGPSSRQSSLQPGPPSRQSSMRPPSTRPRCLVAIRAAAIGSDPAAAKVGAANRVPRGDPQTQRAQASPSSCSCPRCRSRLCPHSSSCSRPRGYGAGPRSLVGTSAPAKRRADAQRDDTRADAGYACGHHDPGSRLRSSAPVNAAGGAAQRTWRAARGVLVKAGVFCCCVLLLCPAVLLPCFLYERML